jgi:hypothetical protein
LSTFLKPLLIYSHVLHNNFFIAVALAIALVAVARPRHRHPCRRRPRSLRRPPPTSPSPSLSPLPLPHSPSFSPSLPTWGNRKAISGGMGTDDRFFFCHCVMKFVTCVGIASVRLGEPPIHNHILKKRRCRRGRPWASLRLLVSTSW